MAWHYVLLILGGLLASFFSQHSTAVCVDDQRFVETPANHDMAA